MLEADARRPTRGLRTALKLFAELQRLGLDGNYSRITEFIRQRAATRKDSGNPSAHSTEIGRAFHLKPATLSI